MYGNDICKPLPLVAGNVFVRVFLDCLAVHIANIINESAIRSGRCTVEITMLCNCVKSKNKSIEQNRVRSRH